MRILVVSQYFWPESFRVNDLATALVARGHAVTVLTGMPNYPAGRYYPGYGPVRPMTEHLDGVTIVRVPLIPRALDRPWQLVANYVSFVLSATLLGPSRCRGPFDAIFVFQPSPILVGLPAAVLRWWKRVPMLFWVQDLWPDSLSATGTVRSPLVLRAVRSLVGFIYRRCDRVLVQSDGFVARVVAGGAEPARVVSFPNWAEGFYRPLEVEPDAAERREMPEGFRVMFAGNLGVAQSLETIVEAAALLRDRTDIQWVIVGEGRRRAWLADEVRARGLEGSVHLLGARPAAAMPRYLALGDVLLATLRREPIFELTIPSKLQSYLACGRPVLAAIDGEAARIVVEAGAGLACAAQDAGALAAAVLALRELPPSARAAMGARGRAYYETHFDREMLLGRLEDTLRRTVEEWACAS